jgi:hypothetical protein
MDSLVRGNRTRYEHLGAVEHPLVAANVGVVQATEGILNPDEVARRAPLLPKHINKLGYCGFALLEAIVAGQVRSLRALPTE